MTYKVQQYFSTVLPEKARSETALDRKRPDGDSGRRNVRILMPLWWSLLSSALLDHEPLEPLESRGDLFQRRSISKAGTRAVELNKAWSVARGGNRRARRALYRPLWSLSVRDIGSIAGLVRC